MDEIQPPDQGIGDAPAPRASPAYRPPSWRREAVLFVVLSLLLAWLMGFVQAGRAAQGGFQRLGRMHKASAPLGFLVHSPGSDRELAERLGVPYEDLVAADAVLLQHEAYMRRQGGAIPELAIRLGENALFIKYQALLSTAFSALLALALHKHRRERVAARFIESQRDELAYLDARLRRHVDRSRRYLTELKTTQGNLVQAQKLASVGRLSATLAHEIRNPIAIILSAAGMAAEDLPRGSPPHQAIDLIRQEVSRLNSIITDLLDFARPKPPQLSPCELGPLVAGWVEHAEEELHRHGITVETRLPGGLPPVLMDHGQLYQVFLNVLWNARDALASTGGGVIEVVLRPSGARHLMLEVIDDGPGMDADVLAQIREPFFTTKTHGSGLGLPVVIQLMEGMGGSTEITSRLEQGTRVALLLRRIHPGAGDGEEPAQMDSGMELDALAGF